jgi:hypothetical protein
MSVAGKTYRSCQNTNLFLSLQPNVLFTGIRRLLVTGRGRLTFASANHCQGQLQTPQSLSVAHCLRWAYAASYDENHVFCFETNGKGVRSCHNVKVTLKLLYLWDRLDGVYFLCCRNLSPGENPTKPVARIQGQSWFWGIRRCSIDSFVIPSYFVSRIT